MIRIYTAPNPALVVNVQTMRNRSDKCLIGKAMSGPMPFPIVFVNRGVSLFLTASGPKPATAIWLGAYLGKEVSLPIGAISHAASLESGGRSIASGHTAPTGQLSENQRMAFSQFPVFKSRPDAMRSSAAPALKTIVETRERERCRASQ